jgi:succinate dehydrogenase / fumarate reductase cytochrome b subunit
VKVNYANVTPDKYKVGMWAFMLHRISGLIIALYGILHLVVISSSTVSGGFDRVMELFHTPVVIVLELLLIAAVLYHLLNGLRLLLFDLGIGIRRQKLLFWELMIVGVVAMFFAVNALLPLIIGRAMF